MQPGRQADVDQVHRQVGDQPVQIGGGGEPELAADRGELVRGAAEDDHLVHVGLLGVDGGVGLAKPVPSNAIFTTAAPFPAARHKPPPGPGDAIKSAGPATTLSATTDSARPQTGQPSGLA